MLVQLSVQSGSHRFFCVQNGDVARGKLLAKNPFSSVMQVLDLFFSVNQLQSWGYTFVSIYFSVVHTPRICSLLEVVMTQWLQDRKKCKGNPTTMWKFTFDILFYWGILTHYDRYRNRTIVLLNVSLMQYIYLYEKTHTNLILTEEHSLLMLKSHKQPSWFQYLWLLRSCSSLSTAVASLLKVNTSKRDYQT